MHRLDRIDDEQSRRRAFAERGQYVAHRRGGGEPHRRRAKAEAAGAQTHLVGRLLAGNVGDGAPGRGDPCRGLEQQGRLADAGIAADQGRRPCDEPAAHGPVKLLEAGAHSLGQRDLPIEADQLDRLTAATQIVPRREGRHHRAGILDQSIPLGAIGTLPLPAARDRTADLADVTRPWLCHFTKLPGPHRASQRDFDGTAALASHSKEGQ